MAERTVGFSRADDVGVIRLNRPRTRNAIDPGLAELPALLRRSPGASLGDQLQADMARTRPSFDGE